MGRNARLMSDGDRYSKTLYSASLVDIDKFVEQFKRLENPKLEITEDGVHIFTLKKPLTDKRDNNTYKVQRLADGKCWMLDNLRLDITNATIRNGLTTSNTHADANSLTSLRSGNRSAGNRYASSGFVTWAQGDAENAYNQAKANADYKDTTTTSYGAGSGKTGVFYNYCAASAGSYCYDRNTAGTGAQYDLCPAGWRMPTGGASGEYQILYATYGSNDSNFRSAFSSLLSGNFFNGSANSQGNYGLWYSSTRFDNYNMDTLFVYTNTIISTGGGNRDGGYSLRCIVQ